MTDSQNSLPGDRNVWLTSFWDFTPDDWGCVNFTQERWRTSFINQSVSGDLVAVYIAENSKLNVTKIMRGKVIGIYEISHECGDLEDFISPNHKSWREKANVLDQWRYAVQATRAWKIKPEEYKRVKELFPESYDSRKARFIASHSTKVTPNEADGLLQLKVQEWPVYGQYRRISQTTEQTLKQALD